MNRSLLVVALMVAGTGLASGEPQCTTANRSQWQDATAFQNKLKADGYEIRKFKITSGNCYEIYGWNKAREKVEIYFDPVTGKAIKTEIH